MDVHLIIAALPRKPRRGGVPAGSEGGGPVRFHD